MSKARPLPRAVKQAIKCGHVPTLRAWRGLPLEKLTRAERNMRFVETYCNVPEGIHVGKPIRLADFQEAFYYAIYDSPNRIRRAYLSIARKNSKTATIATIVLVHLVGPEAIFNSRISSGAMSRQQASEVFNYASKMVDLSSELRKIVRPVMSQKMLYGLLMGTEYRALSAEGKTAHGGSPVLMILDEVGQIRGYGSEFVDAVVTSQGSYGDKSLLIAISTQAPTDADMFSVWLDDAESSQDPSIVSHLYSAPIDCNLDDEGAWELANPAIGLFRSRVDVEENAKQAMRMPADEARFRVLFLNQRVNMVAAFIAPSVWKAGNGTPNPICGQVYGGLDLSSTTDLTSLVLINRQGDELGVHPYFWMPHDTVQDAVKRDRAPYDAWVKAGFIRTTPGSVVDYAFVARDLGEICGGLDIVTIAFDPWRMDRLESKLRDAGIELPLEAFGQGYKSMSPALDALEAELLNESIRHGANPPLAMCAANAVVHPDPSGNRKLDKRGTGKIDGIQALAMACGIEAVKVQGPKIDDFLNAPIMVV